MKPKIKLKVVAAIVAVFVISMSFGQSKYDGDGFTYYLGKSVENDEVKDFASHHRCEMGNPGHCASKEGVELMLQKGMVTDIRLYQSSNAYGNFKGKLPKGIRFGMSSGEVKGILGKPSVTYNSGYSEYELRDCSVSCWFEEGKLSQLTISSKS